MGKQRKIYFVTGAGKTKIGVTEDVEARYRSLKAGSPVPLKLVHVTPGSVLLEKALHSALKADGRHSHGGWFDGEFNAEEAVLFVSECAEREDLHLTKGARRRLTREIRELMASLRTEDLDRAEEKLIELRKISQHSKHKSWIEGLIEEYKVYCDHYGITPNEDLVPDAELAPLPPEPEKLRPEKDEKGNLHFYGAPS